MTLDDINLSYTTIMEYKNKLLALEEERDEFNKQEKLFDM